MPSLLDRPSYASAMELVTNGAVALGGLTVHMGPLGFNPAAYFGLIVRAG